VARRLYFSGFGAGFRGIGTGEGIGSNVMTSMLAKSTYRAVNALSLLAVFGVPRVRTAEEPPAKHTTRPASERAIQPMMPLRNDSSRAFGGRWRAALLLLFAPGGALWFAAEPPPARILWRERIGSSSGSPVVQGGKVLIGTNNAFPRDKHVLDDRGVLMCFDAKGGAFLGQVTHPRLSHRANDVPGQGICCRPCVDGNHAYYLSNRGELVCVALDRFGTTSAQAPADPVVWKLDTVAELGVFKRDAGDGGNPLPSPAVLGDLVYFTTGNGSIFGYVAEYPLSPFVPRPGAPSFVAADKKTGKVVWSSAAPGRDIQCGQWAGPAVASLPEGDQVIVPGGDGLLYGFAPRTGRLLWKQDCNQPGATARGPNARGTRTAFLATPAVRDATAFVAMNQDRETDSSVRRPILAVAGKANAPRNAIRWRFGDESFEGTFGSVALGREAAYVLGSSGILYCINAKTGSEVWRSNLGVEAGRFSSPCVHDGKVLVPAGQCLFIFADSLERKSPARVDLGSATVGTPAAVKSLVYVATRDYLYCVQLGY
jgi:outer membrane protein assembly factor BamB